ncbi:MAG: Fe-S-containing protein [Coriobacteriia bacterium]
MSNKKNGSRKPAAQTNKQVPPKKKVSTAPWVIAAAVVVVMIGVVIASQGQQRQGGVGGSGSGSGTGIPVASAEEAKYIGRFLPVGYQEAQAGVGGPVAADTPMSPIEVTADDAGLSIPLAEIEGKRNVSFQYTRSDGSVIPLIAYVKPSGQIFVGVSFCVPCQGTGQTLTTDGMLTCDACGTKRDPESGVGVSGSCKLYPLDELPVKAVGDNLVIDKAALDSWTVQPTDRKVG